jgi:hypothetical protein
MRHLFTLLLILTCFAALFLICYAPTLFLDRQFGFRDSAHYYYPLNQRVQEEWNQGRWPLWEPEENSGMPLLGNPTAAVLYPGKLIFAVMPYAWGARVYIMAHSALAFFAMLLLMRSWGTTWFGSSLSALGYTFGAPILFQYSNVIYLIGAAWLPLGVHAVDRWARLGRRWGLLELAIVLSMQTLGGDPQVAYLLGLGSIGYSLGLAWHRARLTQGTAEGANRRFFRVWQFVAWLMCALVVWCVATLTLAQWFPKLREPGMPTPPFFWMIWVPPIVGVIWVLVALGFVIYWWKREWHSPLALTWLGLAASAALSVVLTAAQLLPVIEFTQRTSRVAQGGTHEIYPFSIEPFRLLEIAWPNILGTQFEGNNYWGEMIHIPGARPKAWVPSLYLGGLTFVLALSSLTLRHGPPWRVWFTVIVVVSLLGSLGRYTSPIWMARVAVVSSKSAMLETWLPDLGPIDPADSPPLRKDGYLRDGDGSFYWALTHLLPAFRQFRFPAKLFTFTTLGLAILAGVGWDRVFNERARGALALFFMLLVLTLAVLAGVIWERDLILASFRTFKSQSMLGPLDPDGGYQALIRSLGQAAIVFGLGVLLTIVARKRPYLAGSAAVIVMTADLATANARHVLTVPQAVLETKPEVLKIIEDAERAHPSPGPYRIHRMPIWSPLGWYSTKSKDRNYEIVSWEHDTIQPKYGINLGVEYTHTLGVAELLDYDWYFNGFPRIVRDEEVAKAMGIELNAEVVYFPRRAFDMWNTRYLILPYWHGGWRDEFRGYASFLFETKRIFPESGEFNSGSGGKEAEKDWIDTKDFRIMRNLQEFPRAWIVHNARMTLPISGVSGETRSAAFQEILHAGDRFWNDSTQRVYDPHNLAWVGNDDMIALGPYLSGERPRASETVKVTYPNPHQAVLEVDLDSPGLVVLADVFYPGWELTIDDKVAPVYRVNGLMRGAAVIKGPHHLVYTYNPQSFRIGLFVSIGGLAAFLVLSLACARWPVDRKVAG